MTIKSWNDFFLPPRLTDWLRRRCVCMNQNKYKNLFEQEVYLRKMWIAQFYAFGIYKSLQINVLWYFRAKKKNSVIFSAPISRLSSDRFIRESIWVEQMLFLPQSCQLWCFESRAQLLEDIFIELNDPSEWVFSWKSLLNF